MIYLLLVIIFLMAISYYNLIDNSMVSPFILLTCGYIVAIVSAVMNIDEWNINLHFNTFFLLVFGIVSFMLGCIFVRITRFKVNFRGKLSNNISERNLSVYKIERYKLVIVIVIQIITLLLLYKEVQRIAVLGGYTEGNNIMTYFRQQTSYSLDTASRINTYVQQLMNITQAAGFCFMFIFIRNIIIEKSLKNNYIILIPVALYTIQGFLQGGRGQLIKVLVIVLVSSYITYIYSYNIRRNIEFKYIRNGIVCITLLFIAFYFSKEAIGRITNENFLEYITRYTGGSIQLLDMYMQDSKVYHGNIIGAETFPGIIMSLNKLGIISTSIIKSLEFRTTSTGIFLGNIYTGLRRFYNDFGWSGVFICQFFMGFILEFIYKKIKAIKNHNNRWSFFVLLYSYLCYSAVQQAMEDVFYISMIALGFLVQIIILRIVFWAVIQVKISYR